ncbi:unnamed protein product [Linum tenue]|uniref:Uncharacterized protein n=1 Tax=Linum tenue TaxID=586396 RepID=A0AAV0MBF2_9ROSI|nr:unnamed protein product [Linum tenue]
MVICQAVTSLCWQRSKPVVVNDNCTAERALLGGSVEDSILMPDPLPSVTSASHSEVPSLSGTGSGSTLPPVVTFSEETPLRRPGGPLTRLKAPRTGYNFTDDMEVFSPLVEVQPITPSLDKYWDNHEGSKLDNVLADKKPSAFVFPSSSSRRYPFPEDGTINEHPIYDWKSSSNSRQDDSRSSHTLLSESTPPSSKSAETSITPPEAWGGGERFDKIAHLRQTSNVIPPRLGISTSSGSFTSGGSMLLSGMQDISSTMMNQTSMSSVTTSFPNSRVRDISISQETSIAYPEQFSSFSHLSMPLGSAKSIVGLTSSIEAPSGLLASPSLARRFSTYAERISTTSSFSDGISLGVASPKVKKTGFETREDLLNSLSSRSDSLAAVAAEPGVLPLANGGVAQPHKALLQPSDLQQQQGSSFPLQLFQRAIEETLGTFGDSLREEIRNLHIEVLRQFHMQECSNRENQAEMMKKIESLQKENQELRQLLRQ